MAAASTDDAEATEPMEQVDEEQEGTGAEAEAALRSSFPLGRVRRIIRVDREIKKVTGEAALLIAAAAELFVGSLTAGAHAAAARRGRRALRVAHVRAAASAHHPIADFLLDCLPVDEEAPSARSAAGSSGAGGGGDGEAKPLPRGTRRIDAFFQKLETMSSFRSFIVYYPEVFLAILCFLSFSLFGIFRHCRSSFIPVNWPVIGMLPFIVRNLHHLHDSVADALREVGCTFMFHGPWLLNMIFLVTCDPANVNHCFNTNFANYPKGYGFTEMFDILGDGLLVADSDSWEYQRRVAMTIFASRLFRSFAISTIARHAGKGLLPYLDYMAAHGLQVELEGVFMRFSLDVSYSIVFAADLDCLSVSSPLPVFGRATKDAEEAVLFRHVVPPSWWKLFRWLNVGTEKKLAEARVVIDQFIYREIAKRKARPSNGSQGDLLSLYMNWPMDPGMNEQQKDQFLRDTSVGFMFAGKDLVAVTLAWFFYMMCKHPHVEARILDELKALESTIWPGNLSVFECDTLRSAIYLQAALLETLRLFPATPFEEKETLTDDVLPNGTKVTRGTRIVFSLYAMGRVEGVWGKDCKEFRPERWVSKSGRLRHEPSYKFLAFNTGPRSCLGKDLGLSNLKIAAAAIIHNFQVELVEGHVVMPQSSVILHMKNGMMVRVKRRQPA